MGPLILIALGFSVASCAGFFNIGLPGQALSGWIAAGWFALSHPDMPRPAMILCTIIIGIVAGESLELFQVFSEHILEQVKLL